MYPICFRIDLFVTFMFRLAIVLPAIAAHIRTPSIALLSRPFGHRRTRLIVLIRLISRSRK